MKITRKSPLSGISRTIDIPISYEEYNRWNKGELIQNAFPNISAGEREFILTGITTDEWEDQFGPEGLEND